MVQSYNREDFIASGPEALDTQGKEATIASSQQSVVSSQQSTAASKATQARDRAKFILENGIAPEDVKTPKPAPESNGLTGEEYLATVDPVLARQARMYIDGRRPFPSGAAMRNQQTQLALNIAMQADPTLDAVNAATRVATRKDFTSGVSARNLTALNTAIGHLASLKKNAVALNNTWSPKINEPLNAFQSDWLGDPRVNNFNSVRDAFATELAKVFKGTGAPSLAEIDDWKKRANAAQSPAQLMGFVKEASDLLQSRINAVGDTYNRGLSKSSDPITLLSPHAQELYKTLEQPIGETKTVDALAGPNAGQAISGEDVKGFRFSPEAESKINAYTKTEDATAEGYAKLLADAAVKEGFIDEGQRGNYEAQTAADNAEVFKAPPAQRGGIDYKAIDQAASENAGLFEGIAQLGRNLPESAYNLAMGTLAPATDLVKSVVKGEREGLYKLVPNLIGDFTGLSDTGAPKDLDAAMAERYGSLNAAKRTSIKDPLGFLSDVSIPLTLGGTMLERAPGVVSSFGKGVSTAGRFVDPLSGGVGLASEGLPAAFSYLKNKYGGNRFGQAAGDVAKEAAAEVAGFSSGVGGKTIREGYGAGKSKGVAGAETPQSKAFTSNMRDSAGNITSAVDLARDAVSDLRKTASDDYLAAMKEFGQDPVPLSPDALRQTMIDAKPANFDTMLDAPHRPSDHVAWQQMNDTVEHYLTKAAQDPTLLTPLAVDQFKQDLYTIGSKIGGATDKDAARIAGGAYRSVRKMLTDHDPIYADIMKNYGDAAEELASLESGFSLTSPRGKPVNVDAASRKLQSIFRNNANTNYGQRAAQGERLAELDKTGTLMPSLAGQTASSWTPRGLRAGVEGAGLTAATIDAALHGGIGSLNIPALIGGMATVSPRVAGELSYGAGRMAGASGRLGGKAANVIGGAYNAYPRVPLAISRASDYADATDYERLLREYGTQNPTVPNGGDIVVTGSYRGAPAESMPVEGTPISYAQEVGSSVPSTGRINLGAVGRYDPETRTYILEDGTRVDENGKPVDPAAMYRGGTVQAFRNGGMASIADLARHYGMRR